MLVNGETDYKVIHKKTGASITTIRNAGKIKKTQTIQGYSRTKQVDTGKVEVDEVSTLGRFLIFSCPANPLGKMREKFEILPKAQGF